MLFIKTNFLYKILGIYDGKFNMGNQSTIQWIHYGLLLKLWFSMSKRPPESENGRDCFVGDVIGVRDVDWKGIECKDSIIRGMKGTGNIK